MKKLRMNKIHAFAYADDLAMAGYNKVNLLEAINIVE